MLDLGDKGVVGLDRQIAARLVDGGLVCVPNDKVSAEDRAATLDRQYQLYDEQIRDAFKSTR